MNRLRFSSFISISMKSFLLLGNLLIIDLFMVIYYVNKYTSKSYYLSNV